MLGNLFGSSQLLSGANFIHRCSIEKQRDQLDIPADKKMLAIMLDKAADLPEDQKIVALEPIVGGKTGKERKKAAKQFVEDVFSRTIFTDFDKAMELFDKLRQNLIY